jgi:hypothetical protein
MYGRAVHVGFWKENPKERDNQEDLDVDGRILNWISEKQDGAYALDSSGSG